jgi:opacity protein-like surface antigen
MMKKLALVLLIAVPVLASAKSGYYIQGDVGFSRPKVEVGGTNVNENTVSYGVAVGKQVDTARFAADYTYVGKVKEGTKKLEVQSVGLSAIQDFKNDSIVTPYVGARVGANRLELKDEGMSDSRVRAGIGAVAGVQVQVAPQLAIDAGVEYNYLGKVAGEKVDQYGATVGVRVDF